MGMHDRPFEPADEVIPTSVWAGADMRIAELEARLAVAHVDRDALRAEVEKTRTVLLKVFPDMDDLELPQLAAAVVVRWAHVETELDALRNTDA